MCIEKYMCLVFVIDYPTLFKKNYTNCIGISFKLFVTNDKQTLINRQNSLALSYNLTKTPKNPAFNSHEN